MFEWLARVVMLVLAGMVTLSIIGSIAAIPSGTIEGRIGMAPIDPPMPVPRDEPFPSRREPAPTPAAPEPNAQTPAGAPTSVAAAPAPPPQPDEAAGWLEAITYALLALVGLAALACLILWRSLHERRRIADATELLAARSS